MRHEVNSLIFSQLGKNYFPVRADLLPNWGRKMAIYRGEAPK